MSLKLRLLALAASTMIAGHASAAVVTQFLPLDPNPTPGQWYLNVIQTGGTATIEDLTGLGGDLENSQPAPTGAAKLTTINDNNSKAEVYTFDNFGLAGAFLTTTQLGYSYHKVDTGVAPAVAPAMKITIFNPLGTGDNFGTLIYEPYWNGAVPVNDWTDVSINSTTGGGDGDATGGWWWNGGFEIGSGAGGPPLRSLAEWAAALTAADPVDFPGASVIGIGIGIGTFNPGQVNYFDNVSYANLLGGETWDFEVIPEPASLTLLGVASLGLASIRRRMAKA